MRGWLIVLAMIVGLVTQAPTPQKITFVRVFPNAGEIRLFIAAADGSEQRLEPLGMASSRGSPFF